MEHAAKMVYETQAAELTRKYVAQEESAVAASKANGMGEDREFELRCGIAEEMEAALKELKGQCER